ncbi:hypothetical protein [Mycolicibacterium sp. CR10]|uniref:hypothetical protein n=1 Tax=Mycolicibacterium sp. CR10 TaxID=2562314 RepID=UPI0010C06D83|nr:hypothetical protein [Mycolicibacterium sp. CR10]
MTSMRGAARVVLTTVLLCPIAVALATDAGADSPTTACLSATELVDLVAPILPPQDSLTPIDLITFSLEQPDTPTVSCTSEKDACMSASVQTGIYGERYVPPDAVATCMEAYWACTDQQSGEEGVG